MRAAITSNGKQQGSCHFRPTEIFLKLAAVTLEEPVSVELQLSPIRQNRQRKSREFVRRPLLITAGAGVYSSAASNSKSAAWGCGVICTLGYDVDGGEDRSRCRNTASASSSKPSPAILSGLRLRNRSGLQGRADLPRNPGDRVRVSVEPSDLAAQLKQPGSRCDAIGRDCTGPAGYHLAVAGPATKGLPASLSPPSLLRLCAGAMSDLKALQVWPVNSTLWRIDLGEALRHYLDLRAADFLSGLLTALWPRPLDFASADRWAA